MLGSAGWLTLTSLLGLCLGFVREWLLVSSWGAGAQSDAFLVALFLPEAVRISLASGVLSAAALPLYLERDETNRPGWLAAVLPQLLAVALLISLALTLLAPCLVPLLGPGLAPEAMLQAKASLQILAWTLPGLMLQAILCIPLQARQRFVLAGTGSLLFNLPPVIYLALNGTHSLSSGLALSCVGGSLLMAIMLLPSTWALGWRPWQLRLSTHELQELSSRLGPLLMSNLASQGLAVLERLIATLLGEGVVTWVNFARKLINLPIIALMSLNQVLLGLMSGRADSARLALLRRGLDTASLLALPAGIGLLGAAPTLVALLLPQEIDAGPLPLLLAGFSLSLVFGCWNALLARYSYAGGDTRQPLYCELAGSTLNALLLIALPALIGVLGIPLAALAGVITTGLLLMRRMQLFGQLPWLRQNITNMTLLLLAALMLFPLPGPWLQLSLSALAGALAMGGLALWYRPWQPGHE